MLTARCLRKVLIDTVQFLATRLTCREHSALHNLQTLPGSDAAGCANVLGFRSICNQSRIRKLGVAASRGRPPGAMLKIALMLRSSLRHAGRHYGRAGGSSSPG